MNNEKLYAQTYHFVNNLNPHRQSLPIDCFRKDAYKAFSVHVDDSYGNVFDSTLDLLGINQLHYEFLDKTLDGYTDILFWDDDPTDDYVHHFFSKEISLRFADNYRYKVWISDERAMPKMRFCTGNDLDLVGLYKHILYDIMNARKSNGELVGALPEFTGESFINGILKVLDIGSMYSVGNIKLGGFSHLLDVFIERVS